MAATLGRPAPPFVLLNSNHQRRTLASLKGKVVFIDFWASWCGPCEAELAELQRAASLYPGQKVRFLAVNVDREAAAAQRVIAKLGLGQSRLEILWDTDAKAVGAYNIDAMPSSFILDAHGVIRYVHRGYRRNDPPKWRREIDGLLAQGTSSRRSGARRH